MQIFALIMGAACIGVALPHAPNSGGLSTGINAAPVVIAHVDRLYMGEGTDAFVYCRAAKNMTISLHCVDSDHPEWTWDSEKGEMGPDKWEPWPFERKTDGWNWGSYMDVDVICYSAVTQDMAPMFVATDHAITDAQLGPLVRRYRPDPVALPKVELKYTVYPKVPGVKDTQDLSFSVAEGGKDGKVIYSSTLHACTDGDHWQPWFLKDNKGNVVKPGLWYTAIFKPADEVTDSPTARPVQAVSSFVPFPYQVTEAAGHRN